MVNFEIKSLQTQFLLDYNILVEKEWHGTKRY